MRDEFAAFDAVDQRGSIAGLTLDVMKQMS
jgi:hypothetical protein